MIPYFIKTPNIIPFLFKNQIWNFSTEEKVIYLTFDDGPTTKVTPWVLDTLQAYNAKATFFCIGKNIENHPEIYQRIHRENHGIGNHTYSHFNGWKTNTPEYLDSVLKTEELIERFSKGKQNGNTLKLFRPPYGKISLAQIKELTSHHYKVIMWSVLSGDFDIKISPKKCFYNVIKHSDNGSIIVFHDSQKAFGKLHVVLPKILDYFTEKGYVFRKISL